MGEVQESESVSIILLMLLDKNDKIVLRDVDIIPRSLPEHTYWFIRCLEYKFAKAFIEKGSMKFACLSDWCKPDGTSRGDILEGVYASQRGFNSALDSFLTSLRKEVFSFEEGGFTFYKSKEIISYRAHCLYGLNSNNMHMQDVRSQDHQYHQVGKVTKEYFHNLFPDVKREDYDRLKPDDRPSVLLIRPDAFIDYVASKLMGKGVKREEILISPVSYEDYYRKPFIIGKDPEELFSKHIFYDEQSEVRIVVDTRRQEVRNLFDKNGIIELGPVEESIATISDFYFEDMVVEIRGDQLLYSMAKPQIYKIEDIDDGSLLTVLLQALSDVLPGAPMSIAQIETEINKFLTILKQRDPELVYIKAHCLLRYKGMIYDLGSRAGYKMLEHYNTYILSKDFKSAGETVEKFKFFFPGYDMGDYFSAYYKHLESVG